MRKLIKTTAGWIHTTLILSVIIPLLYVLCVKDQTLVGPYLYLKCLVIVFPVVVTDFAAEKCRTLFTYLLLSVLTFAATEPQAGHWPVPCTTVFWCGATYCCFLARPCL